MNRKVMTKITKNKGRKRMQLN